MDLKFRCINTKYVKLTRIHDFNTCILHGLHVHINAWCKCAYTCKDLLKSLIWKSFKYNQDCNSMLWHIYVSILLLLDFQVHLWVSDMTLMYKSMLWELGRLLQVFIYIDLHLWVSKLTYMYESMFWQLGGLQEILQ